MIFWVLTAILILLLVRGVTETIFAFSHPWVPERVSLGTGGLLVVMELAYTVTDPPLRLLRRLIPPLRLGNLALDLGFLLLFIVILVLRQYARGA
ncbi:MAG: YggT family protein [Frankia sp.]